MSAAKLLSKLPYEWQVGLRYLRGGVGADAGSQGKRGFVSFIAWVSMLGIALGVAALIVVLSVVNGFQHEVRERMLGVLAHVELQDWRGTRAPAQPSASPNNSPSERPNDSATASTAGLDSAAAAWQSARAEQPELAKAVVATAPLVQFQALIGQGESLRGALVRGVEPDAQMAVTPMGKAPDGPSRGSPLAALAAGSRGIVLGSELMRALQLKPGQSVALVLPASKARGAVDGPAANGLAPSSGVPRTEMFTVVGSFEAGHYEYDSAMAFIHKADAQGLVPTPNTLQIRLADPLQAPLIAMKLRHALPVGVQVRDWTQNNRTWFEAVQLQKRMLGLILTLIVAVAAFNLVSTLVMTVTDKRADIAILRTLGASPRSVMGIFFVQGAAAGLLGTAAGVLLGLLLAWNVGSLVPAIEQALGQTLLPPSVYFIKQLPSLPLASDIMPIALGSILIAFLATLYPSWRASRVQPAVELRGE